LEKKKSLTQGRKRRRACGVAPESSGDVKYVQEENQAVVNEVIEVVGA